MEGRVRYSNTSPGGRAIGSAASWLKHLRGHGIQDTKLHEDRIDGDMRIPSSTKGIRLVYTARDGKRQPGVIFARQPSTFKIPAQEVMAVDQLWRKWTADK
jgi:hypothetical protein